jgi:hypothetical protein
VPSLLFAAGAENGAADPPKRLMLAMLNHAVRCYQAGLHEQNTAHLQAFLQAEEWLSGTWPREPFSLEDVCSIVDVTPDSVRDMLDKWYTQTSEEVYRDAESITLVK